MIAKFKLRQCILMTDSPNLMLAKVSHYTIGYTLHSLLPREHLHCLKQVWQSSNKGSQDEEIIEGERAVEVDFLANHLHGNGKCWPEVRVHRNIQEPYNDATPYSHMVDLEMAK